MNDSRDKVDTEYARARGLCEWASGLKLDGFIRTMGVTELILCEVDSGSINLISKTSMLKEDEWTMAEANRLLNTCNGHFVSSVRSAAWYNSGDPRIEVRLTSPL